MARSIEPLIVGKVIGDVIDFFNPTVELTVHYGSRKVSNGCEIKPSAAAQKPRLMHVCLLINLYTWVRLWWIRMHRVLVSPGLESGYIGTKMLI
ncbi:Protein MOTHER of FT and TFL1 [Linum perenne]